MVVSEFYGKNRKAIIRKDFVVELYEFDKLYDLRDLKDKSLQYLEDLCENFVEYIGEFK